MREYKTDLFERLASEKRDILLYGMGNGADKIIAELARRGISVAGIFASDGFVRGHSFHGMRVMSYSEVREKYTRDDCVILLAFGSARPEVLELIGRVDAEFDLLIPDMPVCGGPLFDRPFYEAHANELESARALLASESSKALFDRIIEFRLTGTLHSLLEAVSTESAWEILQGSPKTVRKIADFGAYNGDSAREALARFPLDFILAAEPDKRNFRKLADWQATVTDCVVECHGVAVCDAVGEAEFDNSGNRNAGLCTGKSRVTVATATPDHLLQGRPVDYVKYDIEGAEAAALRGSVECIRAHRPALRIALYHRGADLFELPLLLHDICPDYDLFLTRERSVPAWDIDLVAIPR